MATSLELMHEPPHWRFSVSGDLDDGECERLSTSIDRTFVSRPRPAVIDLRRLKALGSAGLGLLVSTSHRHAAAGRRLIWVADGSVGSLLRDTRLSGLLVTTSTVAEATRVLDAELLTESPSDLCAV